MQPGSGNGKASRSPESRTPTRRRRTASSRHGTESMMVKIYILFDTILDTIFDTIDTHLLTNYSQKKYNFMFKICIRWLFLKYSWLSIVDVWRQN